MISQAIQCQTEEEEVPPSDPQAAVRAARHQVFFVSPFISILFYSITTLVVLLLLWRLSTAAAQSNVTWLCHIQYELVYHYSEPPPLKLTSNHSIYSNVEYILLTSSSSTFLQYFEIT